MLCEKKVKLAEAGQELVMNRNDEMTDVGRAGSC